MTLSLEQTPVETESVFQKDAGLTLLVVEDDRLEQAFLKRQIDDFGHTCIMAGDGQQALDILTEHEKEIDVILMDRMMPVMDGMTAVRKIKDNPKWRKIPVVMVTGATKSEDLREGLEAGVFYYLPKPVEEDVLKSVVIAATREAEQHQTLSRELKKHRTAFTLIETVKFIFKTYDEAASLAAFAAHCFPDPERVLPGLAALMINAVEHGNLEIGYDKKTDLIADGIWLAEVKRRQQSPQYNDRTVELVITRKNDGIYAIVTDQGQGFGWQQYITIDPSRAGDNHGRGIAQARALSFDKLAYNEAGNKVVAFVSSEKQLEW